MLVLEIFRKKAYHDGDRIVQNIGGEPIEGADMSIFLQAPAFILVGCGEVLASITGNTSNF